ncbi:DUF2690 domain-containing protein [Kitasatospora sp. NPDC056184]|uniref:DUF2690 domain-containing protein n=1 Tax=Kitasatospora sp. NPDC056184 TaxID=3345738 RepID=UPI0035E210B2
MRHRRKTLAAAGLLLASALTGVTGTGAAAAAPAAVQAGCHGSGCTGQDPRAKGCDADARTVADAWFGNVRLQLRYSPACAANWAKIEPAPLWWHFWVENRNGERQDYRVGWPDSSAYTNMVDGTVEARACSDSGCTGWR